MKKEQASNSSGGVAKDSTNANTIVKLIKKSPDPAQAIIYIEQIDFTKMIESLIANLGWVRSDALQVSRQYRNYLFLLVKYPEKILAPSPLINLFWRQHIIDTRQYFKDCQAIFGHYLHYYPYTQCKELREWFVLTRRLYWEEFGELLPDKLHRFKWLRRLVKVD